MPSEMVNPARVAILSGDPLVGEALRLLLQSAGYDVRYLATPLVGRPDALLDGVRLLLLAPASCAKDREGLLSLIAGTPAMAPIPVLELIRSGAGPPARPENSVSWPCRLERLRQKIESILLTQPRTDQA